MKRNAISFLIGAISVGIVGNLIGGIVIASIIYLGYNKIFHKTWLGE